MLSLWYVLGVRKVFLVGQANMIRKERWMAEKELK